MVVSCCIPEDLVALAASLMKGSSTGADSAIIGVCWS